MGYNTVVLVLNDALHTIEKDFNFGSRLASAIRQQWAGGTVDVAAIAEKGCIHVNAATVISQQHADFAQVVVVGGNSATVLLNEPYSWKHGDGYVQLELIRKMAAERGYTLRNTQKDGR